MKWHVICRIGEDDSFFPKIEEETARILILHFSGGNKDQRVRESVVSWIEKEYETKLRGSAQDLLYGSMSAYLADLAIPRRTAEDRWGRNITLYLPVFESSRWNVASRAFAAALNFLSGDNWTVRPRKRGGRKPRRPAQGKLGLSAPKTVSLLSGGLDSLVGAIDLLVDGHAVAFVSHHGGGMTPKFQNKTFEALKHRFKMQCLENQFYVVPPLLGDQGENTMRSRSILFLGLAVAVADALGEDTPIVVPENGLISLNVPLTRARVASSSTRTTHPHFISSVRRLMDDLHLFHDIHMPYRHMTKGEMLAGVKNMKLLKSILPLTISCSHPEIGRWGGASPGKHCGYCYPCIIRRAAVVAADLEEFDAPYTHDVRRTSVTGKQASDLRAVKIALVRKGQAGVESRLRVLEPGPLPPDEVGEYSDVYERGMSELSSFLGGGG